jgi:hypothetical protein
MKTDAKISFLKCANMAFAVCLLLVPAIFALPSSKSPNPVPVESVSEGKCYSTEAEVGTGWSVAEDPKMAVKQALRMALEGKCNPSPDFVTLFATSGMDMDTVLASAREVLGKNTKIYGGSSDSRGVMTDKGYISVAERGYDSPKTSGRHALAVMTVSSEEVLFGVGSADCSNYPSPQDSARAALSLAVKSAGKSEEDLPNLVLITSPRGLEEETLEGLQSVLGQQIPVIGGTAGGPVFGSFGENKVYGQGVSLAVIYTKLPLGWVFEGGFDVEDKCSGIVTQADGPRILQIDNRPALEVYDEWLGGHISKLFGERQDYGEIRTLLNLHPLYRKYVSPDGNLYFLFSHPWPADMTLKEKVVMTSTKFREGERVYLSHGSWETFLNRIGKLPRAAKKRAAIGASVKPLFSIGYICAGVMGVIPPTAREMMPNLINHTNNGAPFIAPFTWGEQGYFPGIGNKHGNLLTSFVVVGSREL